MKVVKNQCFGGFGLSPKGLKRLAELKGKESYFFKLDYGTEGYTPLTIEEATKNQFSFLCYTVPNPQDYRLNERDADDMYGSANRRAEEITIEPDSRHDPDLVKVVEELGKEANGICAKLVIVEIPDGIKYVIDEYDGQETVREEHRSW